MKNRTVAAFLALFLGGFGVHKFYLKNTGAGIMYVMLFFIMARVFPISSILGVIDAVRLFMMSDREFDAKYNRDQNISSNRRRGRNQSRERGRQRQAPRRQRANPFKKSGIRKYKEFDLEEAIIDFQKGLEIEPKDIALHFNIACAYSLTEQKDKAFHHLDKAVELGYKNLERIQNHDDLAFIRIQPEFTDFKEKGYRISGAQKQEAPQEERKDDKLLAQLNKLKELREKGMITDVDYNIETKKLLRR